MGCKEQDNVSIENNYVEGKWNLTEIQGSIATITQLAEEDKQSYTLHKKRTFTRTYIENNETKSTTHKNYPTANQIDKYITLNYNSNEVFHNCGGDLKANQQLLFLQKDSTLLNVQESHCDGHIFKYEKE